MPLYLSLRATPSDRLGEIWKDFNPSLSYLGLGVWGWRSVIGKNRLSQLPHSP
ncbi:MAG TPA: hypothetical protein IGS17_06605 [Oscillatoriales cyanobacterium M59_W2019_021]|nr:hypothetical protein [Oscillatoriales cyanobacterium M4454_W2019_049]HIK50583.1 hypothetical protein [Oscillatoriales cyanobacterium M59_W2019_021]